MEAKHIVPVIIPDWKKEKPDCEACQSTCQSACKTSCTVSNQPCPLKE
ncbi:MAG TPA: six-cysteine peptide SCIFF [Firmicutes bacterium]|nr:six-cysteine peptide SCIFF [Candidatus Fermentithermobacillaceae bacterium]